MVVCPHCKSDNVTYGNRGLDLNKAATGGLLFGFAGSTETVWICLNCGNKWTIKPEQTQKFLDSINREREKDDPINRLAGGIIDLWKWAIIFFLASMIISGIYDILKYLYEIYLRVFHFYFIFSIVVVISLVTIFLIKEITLPPNTPKSNLVRDDAKGMASMSEPKNDHHVF